MTRQVTRIEFDLNAATRTGWHLARLKDANGPVAIGDRVVAFEPEDGIEFDAVIYDADTDTNNDRSYVWLDVDWDSGRDTPEPVSDTKRQETR